MNKKEIARILGKAGGNKTKKLYGLNHYKKMINKRWDKTRKLKTLNLPIDTEKQPLV